MDLLFEGIFKVFNLEYIFSVIIGTYFLIKNVHRYTSTDFGCKLFCGCFCLRYSD